VVPSEELSARIVNTILTEIGPIARPRKVWIVPDLPKTRSDKIIRRILASISNNKEIGDVTILANPEIVDTINQMVRS
jgi:acetyl-CoA synthetase